MKLKYVFTGLMVLYIIVLFFFALTPHPEKIVPAIGYDKILHFFEFFVFGILLIKTLSLYQVKEVTLAYVSMAFIIAMLSEIAQLGTTTRTFSVLDFGTDMLGIVFAWIIFKVVSWKA